MPFFIITVCADEGGAVNLFLYDCYCLINKCTYYLLSKLIQHSCTNSCSVSTQNIFLSFFKFPVILVSVDLRMKAKWSLLFIYKSSGIFQIFSRVDGCWFLSPTILSTWLWKSLFSFLVCEYKRWLPQIIKLLLTQIIVGSYI